MLCGIMHAWADQWGDWKYSLSGSKATITGYTGNLASGVLTIPSNVGGYKVTSIGSSAFAGHNEITKVIIPEGVISIGQNAFQKCYKLSCVIIPSTLNTIGKYAFSYCSGLQKVVVSDIASWCGISFGDVNANPLYYAHHLYSDENTEITHLFIPEGVNSICERAFIGGTGLLIVDISCTVTSIGANAFNNCNNLTSVICHVDNPISINENTFSNRTNANLFVPLGRKLTYETAEYWKDFKKIIEMGSTEPSEDYWSFSINGSDATITGCVQTEGNLLIPSIVYREGIAYNVTGISSYAFSGFTSLTSVTIPSSVTSIGESAFSGCSGMSNINIPSSVTSIGESAFSGCSGLSNITIPSNVTNIEKSVFSGCSGMTSVTIPEGVTSIGNGAFSGCTGLTSITIPSTITNIGQSAFYDCSSLTKVIAPDIAAWCTISFSNSSSYTCLYYSNPLYYAHHLYSDENTEITDLVIPEGVTSIGEGVFSGFSSLMSVTIPSTVTNISKYAFSYCSSLKKVSVSDIAAWCNIVFGDSNANPLYYAHHLYSDENTEITDLVIPEGVTSIGNSAFSGCTSLTSVTIPEGVTSIGNNAFSGCTGLTSVIIPNGVTSIGNGVFSSCSGLTSVTIPSSVTSIGAYAFQWSGLTSVIIPEGVTSIGDEAFDSCSQLKKVVLPESLTDIGGGVFDFCSNLTSINIPSGINSILFFYYCNNLKNIYCNVETPIACPFDYDYYEEGEGDHYLNATLYVPSGSGNAYRRAKYWSSFSRIVERNTSEPYKDIWTFTINDEKAIITGCSIPEGEILIPSEVYNNGGRFSVTGISNAFSNCTGITSVRIPGSVASIGSSSFSGCTGLTSVVMNEGVKSIGQNAFQKCTSLSSVTIPSTVTNISKYAFSYCSSLKKVIVSDIAAWCNIVFGDSNANPLYYAHHLYNKEDMVEIKNLVIPEGVMSIGSRAFQGGSSLISVTIPSSVTSIGNYAFYNCSSLTSVTCNLETPLPITGNTFSNRSKAKLYVPIGTKTAYESADYWKEFKEIIEISSSEPTEINDGIWIYTINESNSIIIGCTQTEGDVIIPSVFSKDGYEYIVTGIAESAFVGCSDMTSVTIPESVTSIGNYAFSGCSNLTNVTCYVESPLTITANTFTNRANATLYVPYGSKTAYENAEYWQDFNEIIGMGAPITEVTLTISSAGVGTFASPYDLNFTGVSGVKAYIAGGFNPRTGKLVLMHVDEVPAGTGLYIKGTKGTYTIPVEETEMILVNLLVGVTEDTQVPPTTDTHKNYILANGSHGVGFYTLSQTGTISAGKAYLSIPTSSGSASANFIGLEFEDEETTGISLTPSLSPEGEGNGYYTIDGRKLEGKPTQKGVYIMNGKKIVIK